ncbi:MAG TPA: glycosyltransferase 87 family protein, partial [Blastocatellia bacterium]|nr:glycosyltransferase 87 family protein [Blastocatellia bacterium]
METIQPDDGHIEKRATRYRLGLILFTAVVLLSGIYFASKSGSNPEQYSNDFNVYYFAAREVAAGCDPYQNSLGSWTTYLYPPILAELLVPLSLLPLPAAAYVWFLISAASIAAAAWMSASLAVDGKGLSLNKRLPVAFIALAILGRFVLDNLSL